MTDITPICYPPGTILTVAQVALKAVKRVARFTPAHNSADMVAKGRSPRWNAAKSHCPKGHPYDAENTYTARNGKRYCKTCKRANWHEWNARRRHAA